MKKCADELGIYGDSVETLEFPSHMLQVNGGYYSSKKSCDIDVCLVNEIKMLWSCGIHTMGCCCGHGINTGYIQVLNEVDSIRMIEKGYIPLDNKNCFLPKSKHNRG